jgi:hypothetical protein
MTYHRIPNKHKTTINFDTITNNYEVIYVIKTVIKYYLKKLDTSFHQCLPNFVNYKKGALDSQLQVIKLTSCLPMVGGSLRVLRLLPPLKLVAMI